MKKIFTTLCFIISIQSFSQQGIVTVPPAYPKVTGYISVLHPVVTIDKHETVYNFSGAYTVAFPMGINILKTDKFGYSIEIAPFIRSANGSSKTTNVLFHPGFIFRYPHGFNFIARLAFETSGRYGVTPIFNKVLYKSKTTSYYVSVPLPVRFGNDMVASFGAGVQLGVTF